MTSLGSRTSVRSGAHLGLLLALGASSACGGGFSRIPITPGPPKPANNGAQTFHFAYDGGCMDIDMPTGWDRVPSKSPNITRFGNIVTRQQTAVVNRFDVKPGTSLHDFAKKWAENYMKELNKKADTAKKVSGEEVNEPLVWKDEDLQMVAIGTDPKLHEAASYAMGYTSIKVKSDDSFAKRAARINANMGLNTASFSQTVTTEVKIGSAAIHQHFFLNDGPVYLSLTFNAGTEDWKDFVPVMTQMVASVRFGDCH